MKNKRIFINSLKKYLAIKRILLAVAMLFVLPALVICQTTRNSANKKGGDEQAVRQTLNELYAALGRNDAAALERIYADDYTLVNESGVLTTKVPRLAAIKSGELKYESISFDEVNVRMYGNTALVTLRVTSKGQSKGQAIGGQFRGTSTYMKMKGRWQLVAAQVTSIAKQ